MHYMSSRIKLILKFLVIVVILRLTIIILVSKKETNTKEDAGSPSNDLDIEEESEESVNFVDKKQGDIFHLDEDELRIDHNNQTKHECEPIHLAFVCGGIASTRNFYVSLKSILFHQKDLRILFMHILVDDKTRIVIEKLLDTSSFHQVKYKLYDIAKYLYLIDWIPNSHYSGSYSLLKLLFPIIISKDSGFEVSKVITLDTDILVLGDISELWAQFDVLKLGLKEGDAILAISENQSDWYLTDTLTVQSNIGTSRPKFKTKRRKTWKATKRGFNTGVILMHVQAMLASNWTQVWKSVAQLELISELSTSLADQDIVNAILRLYPSFGRQLDCRWNVQLSEYSKHQQLCQVSITDYKLIHMNSPNKFNDFDASILSNKIITGRDDNEVEYLRNFYLTMLSFQGSLLRKSINNFCGRTTLEMPRNKNEGLKEYDKLFKPKQVCFDLRPKCNEKLRTFLYYFEYDMKSINSSSITLVTQLSIDKMQAFERLASHWHGPISVAVYLSDMEVSTLISFYRNSITLFSRRNIAVHLAFKESAHWNYPINKLRNIASKQVTNGKIFVLDVDFVPVIGLDSCLSETQGKRALESKQLLVIAAFETQLYKFAFPTSKVELNAQLDAGNITTFRDTIWPQGQKATNIDRWRYETEPYKVDWYPDYEPFFVIEANDLPQFDERFSGFGWNKVSIVTLLAARNFTFIVEPSSFIIHMFHAPSYDLVKFRTVPKYQRCVKALKDSFLNELAKEHTFFYKKYFITKEEKKDT